MRSELFIALRYLFAKKRHNTINLVTWVAVGGVIVGSMAMVCVMSVLNGFERVVESSFTAFDPDLKVLPSVGSWIERDDEIIKNARKELDSSVLWCPVVEQDALLAYSDHQVPVRVKGVGVNYGDITSFADIVCQGRADFAPGYRDMPTGIMGIGLMHTLGVMMEYGDNLTLYVPKNRRVNLARPDASFTKMTFACAGDFYAGQEKYDDNYIVMPLDLVQEAYQFDDNRVNSYELRITRDSINTERRVKALLGDKYKVLNRREQQEDFYRMSQIEKWTTFMILSFIILIATFNIISSLSMILIEKKEDMTLFRNLGAERSFVRRIFTLQGLLISLIGSVVGVMLGIIIVLVQQQTGWLKIGEGFMVNAYPVELRFMDIVAVLGVVIVLGAISSVLTVGRRSMLRLYGGLVISALALTSCTDPTETTGITLNPTEMTLNVGETRQIELLIEPLSSSIYNQKYWRSSDQNVATVDDKGNVTAVYAGTCTITATVGDYKATCKVTVQAPQYDLQMANAAVYITGFDTETGAMTQVLRLYDNGLTMDSTGDVTGNGLMLSLALCAPASTDTLAAGSYTVSDIHSEYTIKPGEYREEGGKYYVSGSFLGQYTDDGLTVLLLTSGSVEITDGEGSYSVTASLDGDYGENVKVEWGGVPAKYRADTVLSPDQFFYASAEIIDTLIAEETTVKHAIVRLKDGEKVLKMTLRLPLSATAELVAGRYQTSENQQPYTIILSESCIIENSQQTDFQSVVLNVKQNGQEWEFTGSCVTAEGKNLTIQPCEKKDEKSKNLRCKLEKIFVNLHPNYD